MGWDDAATFFSPTGGGRLKKSSAWNKKSSFCRGGRGGVKGIESQNVLNDDDDGVGDDVVREGVGSAAPVEIVEITTAVCVEVTESSVPKSALSPGPFSLRVFFVGAQSNSSNGGNSSGLFTSRGCMNVDAGHNAERPVYLVIGGRDIWAEQSRNLGFHLGSSRICYEMLSKFESDVDLSNLDLPS